MSLIYIHIRRILPIMLVLGGLLTSTVPVVQARSSMSDCADFSHKCCMGSSDAPSPTLVIASQEKDSVEKPSCCNQPISSETSNGTTMISHMTEANDPLGQVGSCLGNCSLPHQPVEHEYHLQPITYTWSDGTNTKVSFVPQDNPQTNSYKASNPPLRFIDWCCLRL
ncbi:MAG: hypothetical protein SVY53_08125 [Chloroflexota bacterium]|nr:hypothetical protein [Chloroflexota bacterium]